MLGLHDKYLVPSVPCTNSKSCVASESLLTLRHRSWRGPCILTVARSSSCPPWLHPSPQQPIVSPCSGNWSGMYACMNQECSHEIEKTRILQCQSTTCRSMRAHCDLTSCRQRSQTPRLVVSTLFLRDKAQLKKRTDGRD